MDHRLCWPAPLAEALRAGARHGKAMPPLTLGAPAEDVAVTGPWPAGTLCYAADEWLHDARVAMSSDQGLTPRKTTAFDKWGQVTLGLPFSPTSPDHGTAFDIAGRGVACPTPSSPR